MGLPFRQNRFYLRFNLRPRLCAVLVAQKQLVIGSLSMADMGYHCQPGVYLGEFCIESALRRSIQRPDCMACLGVEAAVELVMTGCYDEQAMPGGRNDSRSERLGRLVRL